MCSPWPARRRRSRHYPACSHPAASRYRTSAMASTRRCGGGPDTRSPRCALADRRWQEAARARLERQSARLAALLEHHDLAPAGGCELFQWTSAPRAAALHEALARGGILTRLFAQSPSLHLGLPGGEAPIGRASNRCSRTSVRDAPGCLRSQSPEIYQA